MSPLPHKTMSNTSLQDCIIPSRENLYSGRTEKFDGAAERALV